MESMDNDNLVAEFILIHQQNLKVNNSFALLSALKLVDSEDSVKLKVPAVLLDISNSLIRGKTNEEMLDLLEILEKLLLQEHTVILSSLKSAYCWLAVECTCTFMLLETPSNSLFGDALERIWKKRIGMLKERESDLKKAFDEPEIYQKIRETNIRFKAISYLTQLLKEQWILVGCSTLELEGRKRFLKCKDLPNASPKRGSDIDYAVDNVNEELGIGEREGRDRSYRENVEEEGGVENCDWTEKVNEEEEEHELIHDKTVDGSDDVNEEFGIGEREGRDTRNGENAKDVEEVRGVENSDWTEKVSEEEEEHEPIHDKGDETVAQELKELLLEIQQLVDHPKRKEQVSKNAMGQSVNVSPQPNVANRTDTGGEQDYNESENNEGTSSSQRVRPHLPTPEPLNIPPLRKSNAPRPRRPTKFWTPEEVDALREGVKVYGKAWKDIKNSNPVVLADRTEVDLKDKWRNLLGREK